MIYGIPVLSQLLDFPDGIVFLFDCIRVGFQLCVVLCVNFSTEDGAF
jgi:hypothetical protein